MWNSFFQSICRVGIFVICAQAIVHFRARESYEKYIRLLVGIMILIQLFLPLGGYFLGKGGGETAEVLRQFRQAMEEGMKDAEEKAAAADKLLEQMTLEELRRRMEEQGAAGGWPAGESQEEGGAAGSRPAGEAREEKGAAGERISVEIEPVEPVTIGGQDRVFP